MNQDCPPTQLTITVDGIESGAFWEQTKANERSRSGSRRKFEEKIISQTFTLCTFDEGLIKGQHVSNFKIDLPSWLPASFKVCPSHLNEFLVEYRMEAVFSAQD